MKEETILNLETQRENFEVKMVTSEKISSVTKESVSVDGVDYGVSEWGYKTLLKRFKIPVSFYSELSQDIQNRVWRFAIAMAPEEKSFSQMVLQQDTREIQGVLNQDYCILPTEDILKSVPENWEMTLGDRANLFNSVNQFRFIDREHDVWDNTFIGFDINSSEVGGSNFIIEALLFRQVCSNGLYAPRKLPSGFSSFVTLPFDGLAFELVKAIAENLTKAMCQDSRVAYLGECVSEARSSKIDLDEYLESLAMGSDKSFVKRLSAVTVDEVVESSFDLAMLISNEAHGLPLRRARKFEFEAGRLLNLSIEEPAY